MHFLRHLSMILTATCYLFRDAKGAARGLSNEGDFRTPLEVSAKAACQAEMMKEIQNYVCTRDGKIVCLFGWKNEAKMCSEPICDPPCNSSNGHCSSPNVCTCNVGWKGSKCEQCVPLPGCDHGYCNKPYECKCLKGWTGTFCNKPLCKEGCGSGFCSQPGECVCYSGWRGENCTECMKLPGCTEFGRCDKPMECKCLQGYTGNFCQIPICSLGCNTTNGFCDKPDECWCKVGWKGPTCNECEPYPGCRGTCQRPWECICPPGFSGKLCTEMVGGVQQLTIQQPPPLQTLVDEEKLGEEIEEEAALLEKHENVEQ